MKVSILTRLREETAPYHMQTEQNPYATAITDGTITLTQYKNYLEKFYGFVRPVEARLAQHADWEVYNFDYETTQKTSLLEKDLQSLGLSRQEIEALPECPDLPEQGIFTQAAGVMYVLEGSILGGQMIIRMLNRALGVQSETNGHYFNSYGDKVRERWKSFQQLLMETADSTTREDQIIEAAKETFRKLDHWFKP